MLLPMNYLYHLTAFMREMIFRGLYHFSVAYDKGIADDSIKYFAALENQDLGVVKAKRLPVSKLDLSPFPAPS
jgi:ABC-type xylose transport system substrate-binding protein